ncbi:MAG: thioredoxin domain-containing protein [Alphaproteobacteria bacterium]|nr:thioredoxin domain-containing protein [Alphaproteobacteria bacterium]
MPAANLLGAETSPYLLQHADNPVHWRAWNDEALAEAKRLDRPILLSIGYAACHWCHVMAHESFEDSETAALMNSLFVNIKVDREERPDLDQLYQAALAFMGEQGGWPLTMFLTPDREPFWGGTYFPPTPRYGRPSFRDVLGGVGAAWRDKPADVARNVAALAQALRARGESVPGGEVPIETLDRIAERLAQAVDPVHGGIAGTPKFPNVGIFELIWRGYRRLGDAALSRAVAVTLDRMSQGGIYDHLGGGFARYSTDAEWLVPHFEKMLYDNAQLIELLTLVWQETRSPLYAARVAETIGWVEREMSTEDGAFAATLDADSEGEEGRFYVWTEAEIDEVLGEEAERFKRAYGVVADGNWEGRTILNRSHAAATDPVDDAALAAARGLLLARRATRVRPGIDDKILADWNGMMIAALARAGFAFDRPGWIALGARALAAIRRLLVDPADGRLRHSFRAGRRGAAAMLDDYASLARGALALHEATGDAAFLDEARRLADAAHALFWDTEGGGYFFTAESVDDVLARGKSAHDGATPSGNGTMAQVLARLHFLTGEARHRDRAAATIAAFSGELQRNFFPLATLLNAAELLARGLQIVVVGEAGHDDRRALLRAVACGASLPNLVLQQVEPDAALPAMHPAHGKGMRGGRATAYLCEGTTCSAPFDDPAALADELTAH